MVLQISMSELVRSSDLSKNTHPVEVLQEPNEPKGNQSLKGKHKVRSHVSRPCGDNAEDETYG